MVINQEQFEDACIQHQKGIITQIMRILPADNSNEQILLEKVTLKFIGINANIINTTFTWDKSAILMVDMLEKSSNQCVDHLSPQQSTTLFKMYFVVISIEFIKTFHFQWIQQRRQTSTHRIKLCQERSPQVTCHHFITSPSSLTNIQDQKILTVLQK